MTARAGADEVAQALGAGANDYVCKPYNVNDLQARVRAGTEALAARRAQP